MRAATGILAAALILTLTGCADDKPAHPAPESPDLVSKIHKPLIIAHRGGAAVYPEHTMRGYLAAAKSGYAPEPDIQFLADGTPVALHDPTVDRTMTGITGPVSKLTLKQWKSGRVKSPRPGGHDAAPVTFDQILDRLGGKTLLVPEIKPDATPAQVARVIDMVKERHLEHAVLMQSFTYSSVRQMIDAGLDCLYLTDDHLPSQSLSKMRADGVKWIGASRTMRAADVRRLTDAGFRVIAYTIRTTAQLDDLSRSFAGYFSDDPWSQASDSSNRDTA